MKLSKRIAVLLLFMIIGYSTSRAQEYFRPGVAVAITVSTNGLGGDVVYQFHKKMGIRLGYEQLGIKTRFSFQQESVDYSAELKFRTGSLALLFDYYIGKKIYLTAGAGWNRFHAMVAGKAASPMQFGDIQIPMEKIGTFTFLVDPTVRLSPYLGIGFGHTMRQIKRVGFSFEIGGFYQGSPDISITSTGLLSPTSNPDQQHDLRLEKQINQYQIYPVLRFNLSYRIVEL